MNAVTTDSVPMRRDALMRDGRRRGFRVAAVVTAGALLGSCSDGATCCDPVPPCVLTVTAGPSVSIEVFGTATVSATGSKTGECGTVKRLWSSANPAVAAVSSQGVVTGIAVGATTVRATDRDETDGTTAYVDVPVTVVAPVTVSITGAPAALDLGASLQLAATVTGAASQEVTWTTSAANVVAVTTGGLATGMGVGSATLTATSTASPSKKASIAVNVSVLVGVSPGPLSLAVGGTQQFTAAVTGAVNKAVTWGSSNTAVATVSGSGLVTAMGTGSTVITATSVAAPSRTGSATVTATPPPAPVLTHRWTFSETGGDGTILVDDIGGANGIIMDGGGNLGAVHDGQVFLAGGARENSDYVFLPAQLLSGLHATTIEVWATQLSVKSWGRIFDVGSSTQNNLFMSWSWNVDGNNDRVEWLSPTATRTVDQTMSPYDLNTPYQVVMTIEEGAGAAGQTVVRWYRNGEFKGTFETPLTLAALQDDVFWLGRSQYPDETANAAYNEVRIYSGAMSDADVAARYAAGPVDDTPFVVTGVTPADGTGDISIETAFQVTFSTSVDAATVTPANVSLTLLGTPVPFSVAVNGPVVTITPTVLLGENSLVVLSISTGVRSTHAKPLSTAYNLSFGVALFDPNYTYRFFNNLTGQAKSLDTYSGVFEGFMGDTGPYSGQFWYMAKSGAFYVMRNLFKGDDWYLEGRDGNQPVQLQNTAPTVHTGQQWEFVFNGFGPGCFFIRNNSFGAAQSLANVGGMVIMQPTAATGGQCWSIARAMKR